MATAPPSTARPSSLPWVLACAVLILLFVSLAGFASLRTCATYDEPMHGSAAWMLTYYRDYRVNPEDPPLWQYWAAIPHSRGTLKHDFELPLWKTMPSQLWNHWDWCTQLLYQTPGNDGAGFIQRSRWMMLIIGCMLGVAVAVSAWQIAGRIAAVVATAFFALDPNFLAHAPLIKNDVAFTLVMLVLVIVTWRVGRRLTWLNAAAFAVLCAVAAPTKFSALGLAPIVVALLAMRVFMPVPWPILRWTATSRMLRFGAASALLVFSGIVCIAGIWACYGFRFAPTPNPSIRLDTNVFIRAEAEREIRQMHPSQAPTEEEIAAWRAPLFLRSIQFAERREILPQAWLNGLAYVHLTTGARQSYLLGERSTTGWWYYFPLAMLFKTPMATLLAIFLSAAAGTVFIKSTPARMSDPGRIWTGLCLLLPVFFYLITAMSSSLNLGIRHLLPIYPLLFICCGMAAEWMWERNRKVTLTAASVLLAALAIETGFSYPHYIAFFNGPSAAHGRLELLSDSNLDWGQDLPLLAEWQRENPSQRLFLCYFGTVDPAFYGIRYTPLPGHDIAPSQPLPREPGIWAVSATKLQGMYLSREQAQLYSSLRRLRPVDVLGQTIYLYEFPPRR